VGLELLSFCVIGSLFNFVLVFGLGMLLRELAPERADQLELTVLREPVVGGGLGLLALAGGGVLIIAATITIIGIPVAALLALGLVLASGIGLAAVGRVVGQALPIEGLATTPAPRLAAGLGVLWLISLVPVGGALVMSCATLVGLGAVVRVVSRRFPRRRPPPVDGPYRSVAA